jgi:hypothetical protein
MKQSITLKRLDKELEKHFTGIPFTRQNMNDDVIITIPISPTIDLTIRISDWYPFRVPTVYLNGIEYFDILKCNHEKLKPSINKCIYCNSIVCPDKWKPAFKLISIVNEVKQIINLL